ncbi:50S ribosomal protein L19 [Patescibacteria group bacterium]|nr:50S ribosomal protein L19 [Patescibacteria group bacterium]
MALYLTYNDQNIAVGDTIRVHQKIVEEKRTRTQIFEGVVIAIRGKESGKTFVVRKISVGGIGVEKIFPVMLPSIEKIEVKRKGDVRRGKLNFLRDRIGKAASKVKEKSLDERTVQA